MKILILCTGNTCRSQMAEGFLKTLDDSLEVYSAGTKAEERVNPRAIQVMKEKGIDISKGKPESVTEYIDKSFDYVITVCDGARDVCPVFTGNVRHRLHIGFEDPAAATGSEDEIMAVFRRVRDEIFRDFKKFYDENIS
ncbi:MAG: arsenate reductase ArsC [Chlorobi bacterium]|nr:arsenate reductase ArsC [Chlorobiota bacterium]